MAKVITYKFLSCKVNRGTDEKPNIQQIILDAFVPCPTQASYDASYPIAEREAIGEIIVEGDFDPEPDTASADDILNALLGVTV